MNEYYSIQSSQDVIKHYGTKGMKWGLRKTLKTVGRMAGNALRHPHLSEYALVKEQSLHRNDRDVYDFRKSDLKRELANNPKALRKKLKQLKKDYKKDNSFTGSFKRRSSIMDEHLAAHKEYKAAKRNAKSKREKRLAYENYQTKVNPYLE